MNKVLQELAHTMNIDSLSFDSKGLIQISIEMMGELYLEKHHSTLLVYLVRKMEYPNLEIYKKVLLLCHYREHNPFDIHTGLYDEDLLAFQIRLPREAITLSNIITAIECLDNQHKQIARMS